MRKISISDVKAFKACRRRWNYASPLRGNWQAKMPNKNLLAGEGAHVALSAYYSQETPRDPNKLFDAYKTWVAAAYQSLPTDTPPETLDEIELMGDVMQHYATWCPENDEFQVMQTEASMAVRLPGFREKIMMAGRIDGWIMAGRKVWLMEHKTCSVFPDFGLLFTDEQCAAYLWMARHIPAFQQYKPEGIMYTFLAKKRPEQIKVLKNGSLSRDKSTRTTADLYLAAIREQGLDINDYREMLAHFAAQENPFVRRTWITKQPKSVEVFQAELFYVIRQMLDKRVAIFPSPNWFTCKFCEFASPCALESNGVNPLPVLKNQYTQRQERYVEEDLIE